MSRSPLTAVPAQRSSLPVLKVRRRIVIGLLAGAAVAGVGSTIAWIVQEPPTVVGIPARDEAAISLATILVEDFVNGRTSAVPAASNVSTDFSRDGALANPRVIFAGSTQGRIGADGRAAIVERVSFYVSHTAGDATQVLEVSVPMRKRGESWVAAAAPSVQPASLNEPGGDELDYADLFAENGGSESKLTSLPYGSAAKDQARKWADVFAGTGKGSQELFRLTGDKDSSHSYDGLGGWTVENFTVKSFTTGENTGPRAAEFGSTWLVMRVALVLTPPGANGPKLHTEYDLLLEPELNPAAPPVTAWGPAGSGPTPSLKDYINNTTPADQPQP